MGSNSEDLFIKPGNQERGWNDPPQFSYRLQTRGGHRNVFPRRAPLTGPDTPPMTPPSSALTPPKSSLAAPTVTLPPIGNSVPTPPASGSVSVQSDSVQLEPEPDVEEVMSVLNAALEACRQNPKHTSVQVCSDVAKRLTLCETSWRSCRLSLVVRRQMKKLSSDLKSGLWDAADETHRSLMVDHVTEVSQWMVGVKRLIAETRKLSPDQLRPLIQDTHSDFKEDQDAKTPNSAGQSLESIDQTSDQQTESESTWTNPAH